MANVMLGRMDGHTNYASKAWPVGNGVTITKGDFVYFSSGRITNASVAGARLVGMAEETATGNSAGTVTVLVCIDPMMRYLVDNDNVGTTFAASHVGQYFDLTGATGAQLADTSTVSATTGQLLCLDYNPQVDPVRGDTSWGAYKIAEHAVYPLGS
jgi:hypothetical protein